MSLEVTGSREITVNGWDLQQAAQDLFYSVHKWIGILFTDILPGNFTCVIPNAFSWAYRSLWTGSISSIRLESTTATATKVADLFIHGDVLPRQDGNVPAILLLHGEHGHPCTMLHLGDIAQAEGRAVFSVHMPYDDEQPENHRLLLKQCIDRINLIIEQKGGSLSNLLLVGHSRGAIEAADEAYVRNNPKVNGVIALAGRLKVIDPSERPCRKTLEPTVDAIWNRLRHFDQPLRVPLYQIAANHDWCIDPEASIVRTDYDHRYVDASHLCMINHPDTLEKFKMWIAV